MKAILEYDLDEPGDREEHQLALEGRRWHIAVCDMDDWLRRTIKHSEDDESKLQEARDMLHKCLENNDLQLW